MAARVVPLAKTDSRRQGQLFVALAALAWSSSGVLQRELTIDTATQLAGRALFAFLFLAAVVLVSARGGVVLPIRSMGLAGFGSVLPPLRYPSLRLSGSRERSANGCAPLPAELP